MKNVTGRTGQGKIGHGSGGSVNFSTGRVGSGQVQNFSGRVGSGQKGLKIATGRVGSGQKSLFSTGHGSTGRPGSALDPQHPYKFPLPGKNLNPRNHIKTHYKYQKYDIGKNHFDLDQSSLDHAFVEL